MIFSKLKLWLAGTAVGLIFILGAWVSYLNNLRLRLKNKGLEEKADSYETRNKIERRIASDRISSVERLRERWKRD